tara:strand:+ start:285 stop:1949 length:1665 start_codon:yes stop_codon:yes gene_type:complete
MEFREEVGAYVGSNTPIIQIVSHEWEVVEGLITKAIRDLGDEREYLKWSNSLGIQLFKKGEPVELSDDQKSEFAPLVNPTDILEWYIGDSASGDNQGYGKPSVLHLEDVHMFMDENSPGYIDMVSWLRQAARMHLWSSGRTIVLGTTRASYIQELEKEMPVLDMPLPSLENLGTVMDDCIDVANKGGLKIKVKGDEVRSELVKSTMGLTVMEANVAYNKAIYVHKALGIEQIPFILDEKKQIIKRTGILEYIEPGDQKVGGLGDLTSWLKIRKEGFSSEAERYGLEYPRGLLLLGFPGCGKSLTAIHTAKTWNYPLLRFDIGRAFGSLVGESERNMRQALKVAEAISPCILWIDEIEKGLSGIESSGQTDGGTSARVLGTFLTWMQEKTSPVFVLATSNNIDRMPPELTRKGRFDEIFFVDLPNHDSRRAIFEIHIGDKPEESIGSIESFDLEELAGISSGYTGAEIKQAVIEGMHVSFSENRLLRQEDLISSLKSTYPMYMTMRDAIENMRLRKGKMYKPAEGGDSEPLPKKRKDSIPLTPQERRRSNPFADG